MTAAPLPCPAAVCRLSAPLYGQVLSPGVDGTWCADLSPAGRLGVPGHVVCTCRVCDVCTHGRDGWATGQVCDCLLRNCQTGVPSGCPLPRCPCCSPCCDPKGLSCPSPSRPVPFRVTLSLTFLSPALLREPAAMPPDAPRCAEASQARGSLRTRGARADECPAPSPAPDVQGARGVLLTGRQSGPVAPRDTARPDTVPFAVSRSWHQHRLPSPALCLLRS